MDRPPPKTGAFLLIGLDMSGTISDDSAATYEAARRVAAKLGIPIAGTREEWMHKPGHTAASDIAIRKQRGEVGVSTISTEEYVQLYARTYMEVIADSPHLLPKPMPGAVRAVRYLATRFPLFMVSACPKITLEEDLKRFGIFDCFIGGIAGECYNKSIDIVEMIGRLCVAQIEVLPKQCGVPCSLDGHVIYVGDTTGDINAAKAAGVISVAVSGGYHTYESLVVARPDLIFDSLEAFAAAIP